MLIFIYLLVDRSRKKILVAQLITLLGFHSAILLTAFVG